MFTGLIETTGVVRETVPSPAGLRLVIDAPGWACRPALGDSIAVNGCCLTVAAESSPAPDVFGPRLVFDAIPETLAKTTLGALRTGDGVNLEQAATLGTLLGGHLVQGHVDGVATVSRVETDGQWRVRLETPGTLLEYLAPKGSVCLDGVSLTIADLSPGEQAGQGPACDGWFEVALIPTTLEKTTLKNLRPGDRCNLECDATSKTIVHWLRHHARRYLPTREA